MSINKSLITSLALATATPSAYAADGVSTNAFSEDTIVFTAPPRENPAVGKEKYAPVAEYLSKVLHKKVVYKHPGTWGVYRTEMLRGDYDIVFDGPHFNSYRAEKLKHNILVKIPTNHEFVVIVNHKDTRFKSLDELYGRTFCTHAPPNLGTLTLLSHFPNPARQPAIVNTKGWDNIYKGVAEGKCTAGIIPLANLKKLDATSANVKIVWKNKVLPNQAFSAGPRLTSAEQQRVAHALLSASSKEPTEKLRAAYRVGDRFESTSNQEYAGVSKYLKNEWGYY
jgi:ABC-type phosphate/phosphonate transport system substrate-binding protein